jgi:hypothetical protein
MTTQATHTPQAIRRKLSALPAFERGYFTAAFWTVDDDAGSGEYADTGRADDHFRAIASGEPRRADEANVTNFNRKALARSPSARVIRLGLTSGSRATGTGPVFGTATMTTWTAPAKRQSA